MYDAIASENTVHRKYIISEPRSYTQKEFRAIVGRALGGKWVLPVKLPLWATYAASYVAEKIGVLKGEASTLNRDKYRIMRQRNWQCSVDEAVRDFGFHADFSLERGIEHTVEAYLNAKNTKE